MKSTFNMLVGHRADRSTRIQMKRERNEHMLNKHLNHLKGPRVHIITENMDYDDCPYELVSIRTHTIPVVGASFLFIDHDGNRVIAPVKEVRYAYMDNMPKCTDFSVQVILGIPADAKMAKLFTAVEAMYMQEEEY